MSSFDREYKRLNPRQKQAVDTIDGPLLVLAGPGTGKTQLLSARVANILQKTDTDPANIVCLTFTVNAANNMRERLRMMVGPAANHVVIKTFHSLAADIITSHPEHFYAGAELNPISDIAAQEIIISILDKLPHDNPLVTKFDGRYNYLNYILEAINRTKDAGLSPEKLKKAIETHAQDLASIEAEVIEIFPKNLRHKLLPDIVSSFESLAINQPNDLAIGLARLVNEAVEADMPTGKTTQTSKLKAKLLSTENGQKRMVREHRANAWWRALTEVYEKYQARLYKRGYLDYSDMLISVINALESDQDLCLDIQESIHYLLVDEFQDSNEAQIKLLHLLVDNPHIEKPNVMVVGDPNQTIYGFNGAMLDNTTDFKEHYKDSITTIDLTDNYRSSQAILDNAKQVITPFTNFHPELIAKNEPTNTKVHYNSYSTEADQAIAICSEIKSLLKANPSDSVAVLARGHKSLTYLSNYLVSSGLSVNYEQNIDVRTTSSNQLIINILSLIQALIIGNRQAVNHLLANLLRHPALGLDQLLVWQLALSVNRQTGWFETAHKNPATKSIAIWLQDLVSIAASQPLNVTIEQLLSTEFAPNKSLYNELYKDITDEQTIIEAQSTRQLLELARQYAQTDNVKLSNFLDMIDGTSDKLFMFSPGVGHYESAVTLMTVHGAKGLEFDHVFIIDTDQGNWKPKASRYPTPLSLPLHINLDTPADYARLMYVAMTRAKQNLQVSFVSQLDTKTKTLPAEQLSNMDFEEHSPSAANELAKIETAQLIPPRPKDKSLIEILKPRLDNYSLNATHLTQFLDLSRQGMATFVEDCLMRFPAPASEILAHGNAMHAAMELAQIQTTNQAFDLAAIKRLYDFNISNEGLTSTAINRLSGRAYSQLDKLFSEQINLKFDPTSKSEQSFSATTANGLSLYGKIDRIDLIDDNTIKIVDYKTGRPITDPKSRSQEIILKQWRHRLQLGFYILLIRQQKTYANKNVEACIIQLDAESADHLYLDYNFTSSELERIEKIAEAVYRRIKSLDLPNISSYEPTIEGINKFEEDLLSS